MNQQDIDDLTFKIEELAISECIPNTTVDVVRKPYLNYSVVSLIRKLKVRREMFEEPDKEETTVSYEDGEVDAMFPYSWWDHFKKDHPRLCRFFGPVQYRKHRVSARKRTTHHHKHYKTVVLVLDDKEQIPSRCKSIDIARLEEDAFIKACDESVAEMDAAKIAPKSAEQLFRDLGITNPHQP